MGKTNLLDAIYYLCFARSYFHNLETLNVLHGHEGFRIEGRLVKSHKQERVLCTYRKGKKEVAINGDAYARLSRHLGIFPAVIITPDDAVLVNGGSEQRRKYIDTLLTQIDMKYLDDLIAYQKILIQRNSLLKNTRPGHVPDGELLEVFDARLAFYGQQIYEKRQDFLPAIVDKIIHYYHRIALREEVISLTYQSTLETSSMEELLIRNRSRDIYLQRTSDGIHRDDILFLLNGHPFKQTASQGQRKNFLFALKLAQYDILRAFKGFPPLLLLDDLFEKLDHERISHLISLISQPGFGQVFITDTEEGRLHNTFAGGLDELQMIRL